MNETVIEKTQPASSEGCCAPKPAEQATAQGCCGAVATKPTDGPMVKASAFVRNHTVWVAAAFSLAVLAVVDTPQLPETLVFVAKNLAAIAPFLALAVGIAAFAKASGADGLIARVFSGNLAPMIFAAALFGGLSPFCSCGVIPLIAALLSMGVPLPAVMAFWLSSPVMDPSMFVLTAATLGTPFAIAKTLAAVGIGLMGGYATWAVQASGHLADPLRDGVGNGGCGGAKMRNPGAVVWRFWGEEKRRAAFRSEIVSTVLFLGKWLTIAYIAESLMLAYVPAENMAHALGSDSIWAIPAAVLVGVPAYLNGYAALPLVDGLIDMGVSPGAGMAFMVAGGVTSIPAAIAVFALVKKPVFALYLSLALVGGTLSGLGYQLYAG